MVQEFVQITAAYGCVLYNFTFRKNGIWLWNNFPIWTCIGSCGNAIFCVYMKRICVHVFVNSNILSSENFVSAGTFLLFIMDNSLYFQ